MMAVVLVALAAFGPGHGLRAASDGNDVGNGGHGVVCTDAGGAITSVSFFDLWYAREELRLSVLSSGEPAAALGKEVVMRLFRADRDRFGALLVSYAGVSRAQVQIAQDLKLIPPQTFLGNLIPAVGTGCRIQPLAVYADTGVLLTDGALWGYLNQPSATTPPPVAANVQVAAFYVHEALGDMLRAQKLAELGGKPLTIEMRKAIARDTVNLTAIAFTDGTEKKLSRRLKRYFESGIVFEKPKLERFEITHRLYGGLFPDLNAGERTMAAQCETWRRAEQARLEPLCDFVLIECSPDVGGDVVTDAASPKGAWRLHMDARLTLVPSRPVRKFSEVLHSGLTPIYGDGHPLAFGSYQARAVRWRNDLTRRLGQKVLFANEGEELEYQTIGRNWSWWYHFGFDDSAGVVGMSPPPTDLFGVGAVRYNYRVLGEIAHSASEVYVFVDGDTDLVPSSDTFAGVKYRFYDPANEPVERDAARLALDALDGPACTKALDTLYGKGAVFATCQMALPQYKVDVPGSLAWWEGSAQAFFEEK